MNEIKIKYYNTKYGELILGSFNGRLCLNDWRHRKMRDRIDNRIQKYFDAVYVQEDSEVTLETIKQLDEYISYRRKTFNIPLIFAGSDFQKKVWTSLLDIPFGSTSTYSNQALQLGNINGVRAVANANGANAISIIVPCHRIIGSNGNLTGYAGGLDTKQKLINLEQDLFIETIR